jgi:uncharacterized protein (DUF58 family)
MNKGSRTVLVAVVCLVLGALAFREAGLAWLALPFLAYLGLGLAMAPTRDEVYLSARRSCRTLGEEGKMTRIDVVARARNLGARRMYLRLADPAPRRARLVEGSLSRRTALGPREEASLRYVFEATRGRFEWSSLVAEVGDPFGLFTVKKELEAAAAALVQPSYRKWRPFPLRLEKTLSSPGPIPIRLGGSGTDFWGIREYRRGDPLKRLYWRLNARNPFKRYTKESIVERTAEIIIVLDGRQRMDIAAGDTSVFEREVEAAASLAAMLIRQGHRVGLFIMGTRPRNIVPDYGRVQLRRILGCLAEAEPQSEMNRESLRFLPTLRYASSAFMIIISPFESDDVYAFQRLRALGYQAILVCPDELVLARERFDAQFEEGPLVDLAVSAARLERRIALERIAGLGFPVVEWRLDRELAPMLEEALSRLAPARRSVGWKP